MSFLESNAIRTNASLSLSLYHRQWRRCRLEEVLRKEVEAEMTMDERDETEQGDDAAAAEEVTLRQLQEEEDARNKLQQYREEQEQAIGEDWQEYLRKQIRLEMQQEVRPSPRRSVPSVVGANSSFTSQHSEETSSEEETWYSLNDGKHALHGVQTMASSLMGLLEEGLSDFFLGPPPSDEQDKKRKKKSKTKEQAKGTNQGKMLFASKFRC